MYPFFCCNFEIQFKSHELMKTELFQLSLIVLFLSAACMVFLVLFHLLSVKEQGGPRKGQTSERKPARV